MDTTGIIENKKKRRSCYSEADLEKIREKAHTIWEKKCQSFNTALNDWLDAEREIRKQLSMEHKESGEYTEDEVGKIKVRAQGLHEEKIKSLNTALDDWLEAEQEVERELKKKMTVRDLFGLWFERLFAISSSLCQQGGTSSSGDIYRDIDQHYVEMMSDVMN
ncbi:MAG: hypothetical protein DRN14_07545 [Thermoplasmata archaeon]|nr:MAG: hypothetical protein DRN14_07545 [Thermoplasmata archaeon]